MPNFKETIKYLYGYRCAICGIRSPKLTVHHIKPRFRIGEDWTLHNLVPLCHDCHEEIQPTVDLHDRRRRKIGWTNRLWDGTVGSNPWRKRPDGYWERKPVTLSLSISSPQNAISVGMNTIFK